MQGSAGVGGPDRSGGICARTAAGACMQDGPHLAVESALYPHTRSHVRSCSQKRGGPREAAQYVAPSADPYSSQPKPGSTMLSKPAHGCRPSLQWRWSQGW